MNVPYQGKPIDWYVLDVPQGQASMYPGPWFRSQFKALHFSDCQNFLIVVLESEAKPLILTASDHNKKVLGLFPPDPFEEPEAPDWRETEAGRKCSEEIARQQEARRAEREKWEPRNRLKDWESN